MACTFGAWKQDGRSSAEDDASSDASARCVGIPSANHLFALSAARHLWFGHRIVIRRSVNFIVARHQPAVAAQGRQFIARGFFHIEDGGDVREGLDEGGLSASLWSRLVIARSRAHARAA